MANSKSAVNVGVKMSYNHNFAPAKWEMSVSLSRAEKRGNYAA